MFIKGSYTRNRYTALKLKKTATYSVTSNILDSRGFYFLRKSGTTAFTENFFVKEYSAIFN